MSIQLKQLFAETAETYALNLVAGKQGLLREIIWVQFCEDSETTDFLRGAELIITTGLCAQHPDWLKNFILALIERDACGLIINIGKYIQEEDITPTIRACAKSTVSPCLRCPGGFTWPILCRITTTGCSALNKTKPACTYSYRKHCSITPKRLPCSRVWCCKDWEDTLFISVFWNRLSRRCRRKIRRISCCTAKLF